MKDDSTESKKDIIIHSNNGIVDVSIEKEMQTAYLDYAMSVIVSRALPDVRDGLKPVQRRILYAMHESGFAYNKPHKKCAKVVGEVIAKYHPHGDTSIYDALVRLAQDFSMGTPLLDGQGNFGSIDNDPPAAMRYTEIRFFKIAQAMLSDLDYDTVLYRENYDGSEKEPTILPAAFPHILVNGSEGIAVGMATNMPPYNLGEVIDATLLCLRNPNCSNKELSSVIPGPDFPTGGIITNGDATSEATLTGRGSVILRSKTHFETLKSGKECIVITEVPYQVIKSKLVEKIGELVRDKKIETISNIRDESNKKGIRVVIEIKKSCSSQVTLSYLHKMTSVQSFFAINSLMLHNNTPVLMGIRKVIMAFLEFRESVVRARIEHMLRKVRDRAHTLIGLRVAVDSIDQVIKIIRGSKDQAEARRLLLEKDWAIDEEMESLFVLVDDYRNEIKDHRFRFTDDQVRAILDMRLARLTNIDTGKVIEELRLAGKEIHGHLTTLSNRSSIIEIISNELKSIKSEFAVPRKTQIENIKSQTSIEELIEREDVVLIITTNGYIKRAPLKSYNSQRRGGKGKVGIKTGETDDITEVLVSHTHSDILLFSDHGMVYKIRTHEVPVGSSQSKGRAVSNLVHNLKRGETITNIVPIKLNSKEVEKTSIIFATKQGYIRRSSAADFQHVQTNGKIAIQLDESDSLIGVQVATEEDDVLLVTKFGSAVRFSVESLRIIKSRKSDGVRGITLEKDEVVSMSIIAHAKEDSETKEQFLSIPSKVRIKMQDALSCQPLDESGRVRVSKIIESAKREYCPGLPDATISRLSQNEQFIFTITNKGFGKRTSAYEYRITNRGGKGIKNINLTNKSFVVASFVASNDHEVLISSTKGKMIRIRASEISIIGRSTKGIRIFDVDKDEHVVSVTRIASVKDEDIEESAEHGSRQEDFDLS